MKSRLVRAYLLVIAVFVIGTIAGGTAVFAVMERRNAARLLDDREDERRLVALTRRLDLDAEQREHVARILGEARHQVRVIAHQTDLRCGHPLLDYREHIDAQIRGELRPAQQQRFDELLAARHRREAAAESGTAAPPD